VGIWWYFERWAESLLVQDNTLIEELWREHKLAAFPQGYRGKDVNGVDFVMLDADVAGCVDTFLSRGNLNLYQTAVLGYSVKREKLTTGLLSVLRNWC